MDRAEQAGLGLAVIGHVVLVAALSYGLLKPPELPESANEPVEVELVAAGEAAVVAPVPVAAPPEPIATPAPQPAPLIEPSPAPEPKVRPSPQPPKPVKPDTSEADRKARAKAEAQRAREKAAQEKASRDKAALDKAARDRLAKGKAAADKAAADARAKADADRKAKDKSKRDAAAKAEAERLSREKAAREKAQRDAAAKAAAAAQSAAAVVAAKRQAKARVGSLIRPHFEKCAQGGVDTNLLLTDIDLFLNPDGTVASVVFAGQSGSNESNRAQASQHKACALRAAQVVGRYTLLLEYPYDAWKRLPLRLKAR